jgi:hypothetical protein
VYAPEMAQIPQLPDIYSVWHLAIGYAPEKRRYGKHWLGLAQNATLPESHPSNADRPSGVGQSFTSKPYCSERVGTD